MFELTPEAQPAPHPAPQPGGYIRTLWRGSPRLLGPVSTYSVVNA